MSPRGGGAADIAVLGQRGHLEPGRERPQQRDGSEGRECGTRPTRGTPNDMLPYCKDGSLNPSAKAFPIAGGRGRKYTVYDPKTKKIEIVDTCFSTFHLNFAADRRTTRSGAGSGGLVGWVNTKVWDETHDRDKAQGWTELIVDTNGNGKRDAFVAASSDPVDPTKDTEDRRQLLRGDDESGRRLGVGLGAGSPGALIRVAPGSNPPETALAEIYNVPADKGFSPRGADVDKDGVAWTVLGSGHLASFDRRKCKGPLNGPNAARATRVPKAGRSTRSRDRTSRATS